MIKKIAVYWDNFLYKVLIKNLLKISKLGYGTIVEGAESGVNFEHIYNNQPEGRFVVGKYIDKVLLNLPAVHATRGRKEDIKRVLWNEIHNNKLRKRKTRVLDLASGGARYLRELAEEHRCGDVESVGLDKDSRCVQLGRSLVEKEGLKNLRFVKGDLFKPGHLQEFALKIKWKPNVVVASGLFIYFSNQIVEKVIKEIYELLPDEGLLVFSSYERLDTKKLMRKTMSTSSGEEWTLYYRKPEYWRGLLREMGFRDTFIFRDQWLMNNICTARK